MNQGRTVEAREFQGFRMVSMEGFSDIDTLDYAQSAPFGIDSAPIKDMVAVYCDSSVDGAGSIIGYFNRSNLAEEGEIRVYSVDENGDPKAYIWCKKNSVLLLNGDGDNIVRYSALNTAVQQFLNDIKIELAAIASGITTAGGAYTPNPTLSFNISGSKVDNVKTNG